MSADNTPARWLYARLKPLIEDAVARADAIEPGDDHRDRRVFLDIAVALSQVLLAYRPARKRAA